MAIYEKTSYSNRNHSLIYYFLWSGLNKKSHKDAPKESIRFGRALRRLVDCILVEDPELGPTLLSKFSLADAYMCIWVWLGDMPDVLFLAPKKKDSNPQLMGFHLSISMGHTEPPPTSLVHLLKRSKSGQ